MEGLKVLDTLSEQEKDSNRWLGNCIFWKNFESLDRKNIYRTSSIEYRSVKLWTCEAIFYFVLLILLTAYAYNFKSPDVFATKEQQRMYWGQCDASQVCQLDSVTTHKALYKWMRTNLIEKVFVYKDDYHSWKRDGTMNGTASVPVGTADGQSEAGSAAQQTDEATSKLYDLDENSFEWHPRYVSDTKTIIMLGNVRIRQVRVKPNGQASAGGCDFDERLTNDVLADFECYPRFSAERESKITYSKEWTLNKEQYIHRTDIETNQIPIEGYFSTTYGGSGYFFDLKLNKAAAIQHVVELEEWQWLDSATRAVIVEFSVANPNVNLIVNHRILFEFGATGARPMHQIFPFRVATLSLSYLDYDLQTLFILQCFVLSFFIMYYCVVGASLWQSGLRFFSYLWNLCDLLIIIIFIYHLAEQSNVYSAFRDEPSFLPETLGRPEIFAPFSKLIEPIRSRNNSLAFLCLFCWLRLVKYFTLLQSFRLLVRVLEKTVWDFFSFASLLMVIFGGFSIAFYVGFGNLAPFSTLQSSFYSLFFMLARSTNISGLFESSWLGEALFFAYLILVFFLLFNMFKAIVIDTFSIATLLNRNIPQGDSPLACFFVAYFNRLRGVSLVGSERKEDIGSPDEQFISTRLLPKPIADEWCTRHDDMLKIIENEGYKVDWRKDVVSRVQLQRMIDESEQFATWLGTTKAIDVIRRFQVPELQNPYEEVAKLQEDVFLKINQLERSEKTLTFNDTDSLRMISMGLHDALTELQNQWRKELTSVLEVITTLSEGTKDICSKVEQVQTNHLRISSAAFDPSDDVGAKPHLGSTM
eukprot:GEMP01013363.1.p1 GENE.GEMP01013363.1~~GEMP01013363.1.p1  ORF type:complete len:813 (+),score=100.45 GEMP01013363.1:141-2579(+)